MDKHLSTIVELTVCRGNSPLPPPYRGARRCSSERFESLFQVVKSVIPTNFVRNSIMSDLSADYFVKALKKLKGCEQITVKDVERWYESYKNP